MSGTEYTFYFAWTPPDTPWDLSLARHDENMFDLQISHDEGQIPEAVITIKNPRIGLISPTRLYWAWFSYSWGACGPLPLFFGRLVGIPEEIIENTIRLKFIARDTTYIYDKQRVARSLKILPNYDPLCFDVSQRDDPDAILEGWSALYHVDRINGRVSASDILVGEDGTVTFATEDVSYDSVQYKLLQSPLVAVNVKIAVEWEQRYRGSLYVGQWAFPTLGSDPFVGDWPKSGSSLGGGWRAGVSWAGERDPSIQTEALATLKPQVPTFNYVWINEATNHTVGDIMSIEINYVPTWGKSIIVKQTDVRGLILQQLGGDAPDAKNQPSTMFIDWFCYKTYNLDFLGKQSVAMLTLTYEANRKRSERLEMTIRADVQPVLIDPLITEDTEQITIKSGDLSLPIVDLLNWDSVGMGGAVTQGQLIFPDNPLVPGQTSSQIALNSGNTGMTQPVFSNISGATITDGTVTWVSLGETPPSDISQDWVRFARVPLGALLLPMPISGVPDLASMTIPGSLNYPPTGTGVPLYSIFSSGNGGPGDTMYECTVAGMLGGLGPQAAFQTFINPSGKWVYMCIQSGTTGEFHPTASFPGGLGNQTHDGSVIWQCISVVSLPIGGSPGMTPASTYFPTDRGIQTMLHGYCRARAKLRKRARAVRIDFDTRFEVAALLNCRMNGAITNILLPGGRASGKVISYKLLADGSTGEVKGAVTLGCSIGKAP